MNTNTYTNTEASVTKVYAVKETTTTNGDRLLRFSKMHGNMRRLLPGWPRPTKSDQSGHERTFSTTVFLGGDTVMPDTVSQLLMQAGDIESNPGPDTCKGCSTGFTNRDKPIRCGTCREHFHSSTCTGERWKTDKCIRLGKVWECKPCRGVGSNTNRVNHNEGVIPDKCKHAKCKKPKIRATATDFLVCSSCKAQFHKQQSCSGMTREQVKNLIRCAWKCEGCEGKIANPPPPATETTNAARFKAGTAVQTRLNIMQWNCDSLLSKVEELKTFLQDQKIDIFALQETKMITTDKTPKIHGYTIIRQDRPQPKGKEKNRGGGLIMGIKDNIPFRRAHIQVTEVGDTTTESITIEIPTQGNQKLRITNIYVPPIRSTARDTRTEMSAVGKWPCMEYDMILCDANAHSLFWDENCKNGKSDSRGEILETWFGNRMTPLNDGKPTHMHRSTGTMSTPDISLVHSSMLDKTTWRMLNELGSDHKLMIITYGDAMPKIQNKPQYKWKIGTADWEKFTQEIEEKLPTPEQYHQMSVQELEKTLRETIIEAGNHHVKKKKLSPVTKCWFTPEIKEAMARRNVLSVNFAGHRQEYLAARREVSDMIKEEKTKRWIEYVETIERKTNPKEVWKTIRNIDGRRAPPNVNEALEVNGVAYTEDKDKAEEFAKTYRSFSKLPVQKSDRGLRRGVRVKMKKKPTVTHESEVELTMEELEKTIKDAKTDKAQGDDDIPNEFIKKLGPGAKWMLLYIYNSVGW